MRCDYDRCLMLRIWSLPSVFIFIVFIHLHNSSGKIVLTYPAPVGENSELQVGDRICPS